MLLHRAAVSSKTIVTAIAFLVSLVGAVSLYAWRAQAARSDLIVTGQTPPLTMHLGAVQQLKLLNIIDGKLVTLKSGFAQPMRLLVILSAGDCGACLTEVAALNDLVPLTRNKRFTIDLLFTGTTLSEVRSFVTSYQPGYGVLLDAQNQLPSIVGLPEKTPISVLVDGKFQVRSVQPATADPDQQQSFIKQVRELVTYYSPS